LGNHALNSLRQIKSALAWSEFAQLLKSISQKRFQDF